MNVPLYRTLRRMVGATVFLAALWGFAGVWHPAASGWTDWFTGFQLGPALVGAAKGGVFSAAVVLGILLLTLGFGRVYCAMLCPLGIWMDWVAKLAGRSEKKRRLLYAKARAWPRVMVLAVWLVALGTGAGALVGWLDPYSLFGRGAASVVRLPLAWASNSLALRGIGHPVPEPAIVGAVLAAGAAGLLLTAGLALWRGRIWCNSVCPVGALLGLFSRVSLFRLKIAEQSCVACSLCEKTCPAQCIDYRNHRIDASRCVMCLDCVAVCRKSGIQLLPVWKHSPALPAPAACPDAVAAECDSLQAKPALPMERRVFLLAAGSAAAAAWESGRESEHGKGKGHGRHGKGQGRQNGRGREDDGDHGNGRSCSEDEGKPKQAVLPPGARGLAHFQERCTACHLCVARCPEQVLRPAFREHGLAGFLQPFMDYHHAFCSYECAECGQVCPTGAIEPLSLPERKIVQTGVARFHRGRCVVKTDGTSCGACSEHCPTQAVHMVPFRGNLTIPKVEADLCIGCGGCEYICPVRPERAIRVEGLAVHRMARAVETGGTNTVRAQDEEFPF